MFPKVPGQVRQGVLRGYFDLGSQPYPIDDKISRPNGWTLTLEGRFLLWWTIRWGTPSGRFDVQPKVKGKGVKKKRNLQRFRLLTDGESLADGMAIDREGRVYVTTGAGIQVFDKKGKFLGTSRCPSSRRMWRFRGRIRRPLYITAREAVYKLKMLSQGPERPGK